MSTPKAQFQVDHGSGWKTIAEADIINGIVEPPNTWTMVRALRKQIVYTGSVSEEIMVALPTLRDTHFAGFAKALWSELLANTRTFQNDYEESQQIVIARRTYDLAVHILNSMPSSAAAYEAPKVIKWIPDLTELLEEGEQKRETAK